MQYTIDFCGHDNTLVSVSCSLQNIGVYVSSDLDATHPIENWKRAIVVRRPLSGNPDPYHEVRIHVTCHTLR